MLSRKVLRDVVARRRSEVGCGWSLFKLSRSLFAVAVALKDSGVQTESDSGSRRRPTSILQ